MKKPLRHSFSQLLALLLCTAAGASAQANQIFQCVGGTTSSGAHRMVKPDGSTPQPAEGTLVFDTWDRTVEFKYDFQMPSQTIKKGTYKMTQVPGDGKGNVFQLKGPDGTAFQIHQNYEVVYTDGKSFSSVPMLYIAWTKSEPARSTNQALPFFCNIRRSDSPSARSRNSPGSEPESGSD